jgi:hypothetical protein
MINEIVEVLNDAPAKGLAGDADAEAEGDADDEAEDDEDVDGGHDDDGDAVMGASGR